MEFVINYTIVQHYTSTFNAYLSILFNIRYAFLCIVPLCPFLDDSMVLMVYRWLFLDLFGKVTAGAEAWTGNLAILTIWSVWPPSLYFLHNYFANYCKYMFWGPKDMPTIYETDIWLQWNLLIRTPNLVSSFRGVAHSSWAAKYMTRFL